MGVVIWWVFIWWAGDLVGFLSGGGGDLVEVVIWWRWTSPPPLCPAPSSGSR